MPENLVSAWLLRPDQLSNLLRHSAFESDLVLQPEQTALLLESPVIGVAPVYSFAAIQPEAPGPSWEIAAAAQALTLTKALPTEQLSGVVDLQTTDLRGSDRFDAARNQLCPCGSGKKFKRCHALTQDQPNGKYVHAWSAVRADHWDQFYAKASDLTESQLPAVAPACYRLSCWAMTESGTPLQVSTSLDIPLEAAPWQAAAKIRPVVSAMVRDRHPYLANASVQDLFVDVPTGWTDAFDPEAVETAEHSDPLEPTQ